MPNTKRELLYLAGVRIELLSDYLGWGVVF